MMIIMINNDNDDDDNDDNHDDDVSIDKCYNIGSYEAPSFYDEDQKKHKYEYQIKAMKQYELE
jgi:hypothetical protein